MAHYHNGFENIKVTLINYAGNDLGKRVYDFGRLSNDFNYELTPTYSCWNEDCEKLIHKIIEGTTLPKFALQGTRFEFRIENISRICLAQLTRDPAIFASASTGVFPLTQDFNIPMSIYKDVSIMKKLKKAQKILEDAYIEAIEKEIPSIEARYIGLHCQTISLTASYTISDFVRACYSRTSSNFCDECNYVYRLMFHEIWQHIFDEVDDALSLSLYEWLIPSEKCINDGLYTRERLFNSDFTISQDNKVFKQYKTNCNKPALNDWRNSGWKLELERMYEYKPYLLTSKEINLIKEWKRHKNLLSTYDNSKDDVCVNIIKHMDYYKEHKNGK